MGLWAYLTRLLASGAVGLPAAPAAAGVDGLIVVDVPPEEDDAVAVLRPKGIDLIRLATPTTDARRLPAVLERASGFIYYVAVAGITGTTSAREADVAAAVARLRAAVARHADGVVVGSALVSLIGEAHEAKANDLPEKIETFVRSLADAVRGARKRQAA